MNDDAASPRGRLGPFVLGELLGRGGTGVVYRAVEDHTSDVVALKVIVPELAQNPEFRRRFLRDAEVAAELEHSNIVRVLAVGEAGSDLFIAMEIVEGPNLKELLVRDGPLPLGRTLTIFRHLAAALDAAHEAGVVHGDIKPQNILVAEESGRETAFVTDFGLVKPRSSERSSSRVAEIFGTIQYMAPEQIERLDTDGRADVYALACVAYECLTGTPPFERDNEISTLWAHVHENPPLPSAANERLSGGIDSVVHRALSKHPDDRFLTCGDFVAELAVGAQRPIGRAASYVRPLVRRKPGPKTEREVWSPNFFPELARVRAAERSRGRLWRVAASAAVVVMLLTVQLGRDGGVPQAASDAADAVAEAIPEPLREGLEAVLGSGVYDQGGKVEDRPMSRDRRLQPGRVPGPPSAQVTDRHSEVAARTLVGKRGNTGAVDEPAVAASGRIAFSARRGGRWGIFTVASTGGAEKLLGRFEARDLSWSPDGEELAFAAGRADAEIFVLKVSSGEVRQITNNDRNDSSPTWSPDGARLAFASGRGDGDSEIVMTSSADGSDRRVLVGAGQYGVDAPAWSPDGYRLAFEKLYGTGSRAAGDIAILSLTTGQVTEVSRDILLGRRGVKNTSPSWSPDGSHIVFESNRNDPYNRSYPPPPPPPDGPRPTYPCTRETCNWDLYVVGAGGANLRQLTDGGRREMNPEWSPDGSHIVFESDASRENTDIYVITTAGDAAYALTTHPGNDSYPAW